MSRQRKRQQILPTVKDLDLDCVGALKILYRLSPREQKIVFNYCIKLFFASA